MEDRIAPIHPGEILSDEFLKPLSVSPNELADATGMPHKWIDEIVHGKRRISEDIAVVLGRYFGMSAQFWNNLQMHYDQRREQSR